MTFCDPRGNIPTSLIENDRDNNQSQVRCQSCPAGHATFPEPPECEQARDTFDEQDGHLGPVGQSSRSRPVDVDSMGRD